MNLQSGNRLPEQCNYAGRKTRVFYFRKDGKKMKKTAKITSVFLALLLVFSALFQVSALTPAEMSESLATWLPENISVADVEPDELDLYLDWTVFALARSGYDDFNEDYAAYIDGAVEANKDDLTLADYTRLAMCTMAAGIDPRNVGGVDLISEVSNYDYSLETSTAPIAFSLIVLDSRGYFSIVKRNTLINILLAAQREDGGFCYALEDDGSGWTTNGDVDSTAIVLQALARYKSNDKVKPVIDRALNFIQGQLLPDGGYGGWGAGSAESTGQVLAALCALRIDPFSEEYVTEAGKNIFDALSGYINEDGGGRCWDGSSNVMTSYQMLYCLNAYERFENGGPDLFNTTETAGGIDSVIFSLMRLFTFAIYGIFGRL